MKQTESHSTYGLDFILFGVLALIWSSSFLFIKLAVHDIPPFTIAAFRIIVASSVIYIVLRRSGETLNVGISDWMKFLVVGLMGNVFPFILISYGEISIDSGMAAILMGVMPVATVLMAHLLIPGEHFTWRIGLGIAFGVGGVFTLVGVDALAGITATTIGQFAVLGGALCYAITTIFVRMTTTLSAPVMVAGSLFIASLIITPISLVVDRPWNLNPSWTALISVVVLGVFSTAIANILYFRLVRNLGASTLAQINYVIPVLGAGWGIMFLSERPGASAFFALAMVLIGVFIVSGEKRRQLKN